MPFEIMLRAEDDRPLYIRSIAIRMARVTSDFLTLCEQAGLIRAQVMTGGGMGFDIRTIQRLATIHRLYRELDLDFETIDLVLHMRRQIIDLHRQLDELERRADQREQALLAEIQDLRGRQVMDIE
jgi:hypothetical protein